MPTPLPGPALGEAPAPAPRRSGRRGLLLKDAAAGRIQSGNGATCG